MKSLSARLERLETAQAVPMTPPLRLIVSDDPLPECLRRLTPRAPGTIPGPLALIFGGREYDPADLGW